MGARLAGQAYGVPTPSTTDEGETLVAVGGVAAWGPPPPPDPHKRVRLGEWDGTWQGSAAEWTQGVTGAGAGNNPVAAEAGHPGISSMATGTTATGRCSFDSQNVNVILFAAGSTYTWEALLRIPTVSDAVEQFVLRFGFRDSPGADAVDGAYFEVDSQVNPRWQCKTSDNSTRTTVDSGIGAVAGQWIWLKVVVEGSTAARFYTKRVGTDADYVLVATITTNIPSGAARPTGFGSQILKSVGTTSRTVEVDWTHADVTFTTER